MVRLMDSSTRRVTATRAEALNVIFNTLKLNPDIKTVLDNLK